MSFLSQNPNSLSHIPHAVFSADLQLRKSIPQVRPSPITSMFQKTFVHFVRHDHLQVIQVSKWEIFWQWVSFRKSLKQFWGSKIQQRVFLYSKPCIWPGINWFLPPWEPWKYIYRVTGNNINNWHTWATSVVGLFDLAETIQAQKWDRVSKEWNLVWGALVPSRIRFFWQRFQQFQYCYRHFHNNGLV